MRWPRCRRDGASCTWAPSDPPRAGRDGVEALVERVAGAALVVVDPNVRPGVIADPAAFRARLAWLLAPDLLKLSEDDLAWLAPGFRPTRASVAAGRRGAGVLTRGARARSWSCPRARTVAAPHVEVVDAIGAGDGFGGGLVAWMRMHPGPRRAQGPRRAARGDASACQVAALTCARAGASPPTLAEARADAPRPEAVAA